MTDAAIEIRELSKRYLIGEDYQSYDTLRDALTRLVTRSAKRARRHEIWALRDIDLDVTSGETVGVIGANGAGKTTLLKIVSRITEPTHGRSRTRGRVGALLEVGTGFHPELTGRENIRLGGAVLGMSRRDISCQLDDVAAFAGVEEFLDTPLKRYSAGMRVRLAFSVAAHFNAEILAVDDVLAVGDAEFQRRSLDRMTELRSQGRTSLFVSHDLGAVGRLCSRAIWIDHGRIGMDGLPPDVIRAYLQAGSNAGGAVELEPPRDAPAAVHSVAVLNDDGRKATSFERGEQLWIRLSLQAQRRVPGLDVAVWLVNDRGVRVVDEAWLDRPGAPSLGPGRTELQLLLPGILAPGSYVLGVWAGDDSEAFQSIDAMRIEIVPRPDDRMDQRDRVAQPPVTWTATGE